MMEVYNSHLRNNYEMQRNVIFNAIINANRKKNSKVIPLFDEKNDKTNIEILGEREELFGENTFA
ncbi:hypothetical protein [Sutcliffiella halmapala]|uniref:hypothetical protein n=1 Tax=Sutcliffiella halmapala TaxID=79882 RepID=UPI0011164A65|nr:hypothetical protein [Sutcliffiella halmapala]